MNRAILIAIVLAMLSGCVTLPRSVAQELEPVPHDRADHFHKP